MTEFVILIPARLDSSCLPDEALVDIHGKPMVVHVAEQTTKSEAARVVAVTDRPDIQATCRVHGVEVVMASNQHESGTTRLTEAVNILELPQHLIVVNVQDDEPLTDPEFINRTVKVLAEDNTQVAAVAHESHDFDEFMNPDVVKAVLDKNRNAIYFSHAPILYLCDTMRAEKRELPSETAVLHHIGIYTYRADFLQRYSEMEVFPLETTESLEQLRVLRHGYPIAAETA